MGEFWGPEVMTAKSLKNTFKVCIQTVCVYIYIDKYMDSICMSLDYDITSYSKYVCVYTYIYVYISCWT